jgi:phosphatidyl-myo-inositol dimannoside synthase
MTGAISMARRGRCGAPQDLAPGGIGPARFSARQTARRSLARRTGFARLILIATQCFAPDLGGIEALMTGLADALAAAGVEVAVFADRAHAHDPLIRPYDVQRFGAPRPVRRWMKRRAIAEAMRGKAVEGVFVDSWKSVFAVPPVSAPIAVLAHGMELPPNASSARVRRTAAALARAHVVIANSTYTAGLARNALRGEKKPVVVVVPPPIPLQVEPDAAALAEIDALLEGRGPVIATLGRLEPRKGIDATLGALRAIRREFPGVVYLVAGGGDDLDRLRALAASLGVAHATHFLGRIDEVRKAALLARADLFAMPVRREGRSVEGFGLAYIEAAWRGKPAVAGRVGGASDAVIDGVTGLLCEGEDEADVEAALLRLLRDVPLRVRLGAAAAARARGELTWSAALPRYRAALDF